MKRRVGRWHLEILGFAFLVAYVPLGVTYLERPADFFFGVSEISASGTGMCTSSSARRLRCRATCPLLYDQVRRSLGLFVKQGDLSGYYPGGPPRSTW